MTLLAGPFASSFDAGLSLDTGDQPPVQRARPDQEAVAAYGPDTWMRPWPFERYESFLRLQERRVLLAMMRCPPIKSSLCAFKSAVLAGGFQLTPAVQPNEDATEDPDAELSLQILEECKRSKLRMDRPMESWAWEIMDAMAVRNKLSEIVMEPVLEGPDAGQYALKALKVKPHWSYRFRVDRAMNVTAIDVFSVDGEWESIHPDHFAWYSWEPKDNDPRGDSALDAAFQAFDMLQRLWPEFYEGNRDFGTPRTFGTTGATADGCSRMVTPRDAKGAEIPGAKPVTAEYAYAYQLSQARNRATVVGGPGYTAKVLESTRDQVGMNAAIKILEAQCIVCILLTTRSTQEAEYGSKADAENATGNVMVYAKAIQQTLCEVARKPFRELVRANHGDEAARRLTPNVSLGKIDPRSFAAICQAIGVLYQSGFFTEAQMLWLDEYLGLPIRRPGDARIGPQKDNQGATTDPAAPVNAAILQGFAELKALMQERGMAA